VVIIVVAAVVVTLAAVDTLVVEDTTVNKVAEMQVNGVTNKLLVEWMVCFSPRPLNFEGKKSQPGYFSKGLLCGEPWDVVFFDDNLRSASWFLAAVLASASYMLAWSLEGISYLCSVTFSTFYTRFSVCLYFRLKITSIQVSYEDCIFACLSNGLWQ